MWQKLTAFNITVFISAVKFFPFHNSFFYNQRLIGEKRRFCGAKPAACVHRRILGEFVHTPKTSALVSLSDLTRQSCQKHCWCTHASGRRSTVQNRAIMRYALFVAMKLYTCRFRDGNKQSIFEPQSATLAPLHTISKQAAPVHSAFKFRRKAKQSSFRSSLIYK